MTRVLLVLHFIISALRQGVAPWRYFQVNASYFNEEKGIFSKLDLDRVIPEKFRLRQVADRVDHGFQTFPLFLKPEWGQNSHSVRRIDSEQELKAIRAAESKPGVKYILQEAATGGREFEIFYVRSADDPSLPASFSITETINREQERYPVNSINNPHTVYRDLSYQFSDIARQSIWSHIEPIGHFRIARVGVRADSQADLASGNFKIIEINVFLPMPLVLLDTTIPFSIRHRFIVDTMRNTARVVAQIPHGRRRKRIFFQKMRVHYRVKS